MACISIAAAAVAAGGSIASSSNSAGAAGDAANATQQATAMQVGEQKREYNQTRSDYAPYRTTGVSALDQLANIYGLATSKDGNTVAGQTTGKPDYSAFYKSPDYQFTLKQGIGGVDAGASATGSLDSGATRKAEIAYAGNLASSQFNDYANRLAGIAGVGQTATAGTAAAGTNSANQISAAYGNQGNQLASSYLAQGNAYSQGISQLAGIGSGLITNLGNQYNSSTQQNVNPVTGESF